MFFLLVRKRSVELCKRENKLFYRINNTPLAFQTSKTTIHRPHTPELKSMVNLILLTYLMYLFWFVMCVGKEAFIFFLISGVLVCYLKQFESIIKLFNCLDNAQFTSLFSSFRLKKPWTPKLFQEFQFSYDQ